MLEDDRGGGIVIFDLTTLERLSVGLQKNRFGGFFCPIVEILFTILQKHGKMYMEYNALEVRNATARG